jgi:hypothetical protein
MARGRAPNTALCLGPSHARLPRGPLDRLTAILGVTFDARGRLFALETITTAGFPGPQSVGTGKVVCVGEHGTLTIVASGLTFPTGMTFGPDGKLYVSNTGFGVPGPSAGQILRINTQASDCN